MKKVLLLIAAAVAFAACTKTVEVPVEVEVEVEKIVDLLTLNATSIQVSNAGAVQPMSFTTEDAWTIASDVNWITFDKASGAAGSSTLNMTVAKNDGYDARTGRVTLSSTHGTTTKNTVFTVVQSEKEVFNSTVYIPIDYTAQSVEVTVTTNMQAEVNIVEGAEWLYFPSDKAAPVESTITVYADENDGTETRIGAFTVFAGNSLLTYKVVQGTQVIPEVATAVFLGNRQDMYDDLAYAFKVFAQFAVQFPVEDGDVTLVLNVDPSLDDFSQVPAGEFVMDEAGAHAAGTFFVKSSDLHEQYYTTVSNGESEMDVIDGTINVFKQGDNYTIVAELIDAEGVAHVYSYQGEIEVTDASLGARTSSVDYKGQYDTFFATQAERMNFCFQLNQALPGNERWISYFYAYVFSENGNTGIPTGKFTYEEPQENAELGYANGILAAHPGTFYFAYPGTPVYESGVTYEVSTEETPSFEIIKEDGEGFYTLVVDFVVKRTEGEAVEMIPIKGTFNRVFIGTPTDNTTRPVPDSEEVTIINCGMNPYTQGQYFGNMFNDGGNIAQFGWSTANDGAYYIFLLVNFGQTPLVATAGTITARYQDELGANPRYYRDPIPDCTFNYSDTYDKDAKQLLHGYLGSAARGYVQNTYSGTVFHIVGGSVTFTDGIPTFDLQTVSAKGKTAHFTGSLTPTMTNLDFNYQHSTFRKQLTIAKYEVPAE